MKKSYKVLALALVLAVMAAGGLSAQVNFSLSGGVFSKLSDGTNDSLLRLYPELGFDLELPWLYILGSIGYNPYKSYLRTSFNHDVAYQDRNETYVDINGALGVALKAFETEKWTLLLPLMVTASYKKTGYLIHDLPSGQLGANYSYKFTDFTLGFRPGVRALYSLPGGWSLYMGLLLELVSRETIDRESWNNTLKVWEKESEYTAVNVFTQGFAEFGVRYTFGK